MAAEMVPSEIRNLTDDQLLALESALHVLQALPFIIDVPNPDGGPLGAQLRVSSAAHTIERIVELAHHP